MCHGRRRCSGRGDLHEVRVDHLWIAVFSDPFGFIGRVVILLHYITRLTSGGNEIFVVLVRARHAEAPAAADLIAARIAPPVAV